MEKQYNSYWNAIIILSLISAIIPFVGLVVMIMVCIKKQGLTDALNKGNTYYAKQKENADLYYQRKMHQADFIATLKLKKATDEISQKMEKKEK